MNSITSVRYRPVENQQDHDDCGCKGPLFGCRHAQIILYFSLMTITYCTRTVLSVGIVAMTNNSTSTNTDIPTYHWQNQSVVLSAFFWGYVVLQIPAAMAGKKLGAKWLLVGMATVDSVSCLLVPVSAEYLGSNGVIVCRVAQGLAQGGISPMLHMLLGHWAPPSERSVMGSFAYSGSVFGNIIALPLTGLICSSCWGWPAAFFAFGALGLLWVIAWTLLGADRPGLHRGITSCEKKYIESSLGHTEHQEHKTPWRRILRSMPFWAVTVSFVGANWGSSVLQTQTPTYLYKILDYDIKSNSLLSAAPYVAMLVGSFLLSVICDWLINRQIVSRIAARKIFSTIGTILPAMSLTAIGFIPKEEATLSVVILILNGAFQSGGFCGYQVNHMDLSPNHCGVLMGITNGTTSVFSIISPLIVQFIVTDQRNQRMWMTIFITTACVYLATDLFYLIFGSADVQPWNDQGEDDSTTNSTTTAVTTCTGAPLPNVPPTKTTAAPADAQSNVSSTTDSRANLNVYI
ncbi:unnamed protein product [Callosobruchus maculatus]|uniref:Putative inorganic phosphate cotransporter n=1 Tax=Callosobruchus maculatus TaxID=64391 RepID=A0A653BJ66_CALMS|nr:unnamed protein product [Callosobruchus maculatus]